MHCIQSTRVCTTIIVVFVYYSLRERAHGSYHIAQLAGDDLTIVMKTWPHPHCSGYIILMVYNIMVMVVNIVRAQSTNHIDAGPSDGVWDWLSISIVTSFNASITGDEFDSSIQLPSIRLVAAWHVVCILYTVQGYSFIYTGIRYSTYLLILSLRKAPLRLWIFS